MYMWPVIPNAHIYEYKSRKGKLAYTWVALHVLYAMCLRYKDKTVNAIYLLYYIKRTGTAWEWISDLFDVKTGVTYWRQKFNVMDKQGIQITT
jgi:hypothetical protein